MISRILVDSAERTRGQMYDFAFDMGRGRLNEYAGKLVRFGLEWITPVVGSSNGASFAQNTSRPMSVLLTCSSFPAINSHKAWSQANKDPVLALLPSAKQTAYYGIMADTPYLQSTACGGITLGDNLATLGELQFKFYETQTLVFTDVYPWTPGDTLDFSFSLVFWTDEPERPISQSFYHLWVSSGQATPVSGNSGVVRVAFDFKTFEMDRTSPWSVAVSYVSPVHVDRAVGSLPAGLVVATPSFAIDRHQSRNVLAYLPGTNDEGGEKYFGYKQTIKPVCSDTVGIPIRPPLDHMGFLTLELRDAVTYAIVTDASHYTACFTFYRSGS
eukprot:jgi/Tetstr1/460038/TSEL_005358.t1